MDTTKGAKSIARELPTATQGADLAKTLKTLLEESERSADRLAKLIERSERAAAAQNSDSMSRKNG